MADEPAIDDTADPAVTADADATVDTEAGDTVADTDATDTAAEPAAVSDDTAKWKALSRKHERALRATQRELDDARTTTEQLVEQARADGYAAGREEAIASANSRVVRAAVLAAAAGRFADPTDAVALVDLDRFAVNDDGDTDTAAIEAALGELLEAKPHLASGGKVPPLPGATSADTARTGSTMNDWIREAAGLTN